jgi:hypothetical protein
VEEWRRGRDAHVQGETPNPGTRTQDPRRRLLEETTSIARRGVDVHWLGVGERDARVVSPRLAKLYMSMWRAGPACIRQRVGWAYVRNEIAFWQKCSPNYDFLVLHSPSTLSTSKNI